MVLGFGVATAFFLPIEVAVFAIYTCALGAISICLTSASGSIFSPWGFFFQYTLFTTLAAILVAETAGFAEGFLPADLITTRLLVILALFFTALALGLLTYRRRDGQVDDQQRSLRRSHAAIILVAYALIGLPALYRVGLLGMYGPGSWSVDKQFATGVLSQIDVAASLLPLVGISILLFEVQERRAWVIPGPGVLLLALWATVSLILGTRDEVLGPVILLLWAYNYRLRRVNVMAFLTIFLVGFAILAWVGLARAGNEIGVTSEMVRPVASGVNTTALTVDAIASGGALLHGRSYVAAIANLIPGLPLSGLIGLEPAASDFRNLINYTSPSGLGFSPIAEAYWNFGLAGIAVIPVGVGLLVAYSYGRASAFPVRPISLLYPVILCRLPIALRSDFLQQAKGVAIVMLAIWIAYILTYQNRAKA